MQGSIKQWTIFNTDSDLNAQGRQILMTQDRANAMVLRLIDPHTTVSHGTRLYSRKRLDKLDRRETARHFAGNLPR